VPLHVGQSDEWYFPSEHVGQYGVYDALKHLYQQSKKHSELIKEDSLFVSKQYFAGELEGIVENVKADFRQRHKIPDNAHVIFFAPGNEVNEAEFCMENVRLGVNEFILKYSSPTSLSPKAPSKEHYWTVISIHKGSRAEGWIRNYLQEKEWPSNLVIVTQEDNEHYNAMAASDIGFVYDGQMVSAATVCHMPTAILVQMRMHHQWYHALFNRWWNTLNILADKDINPEYIGGEVWWGKICDTIAEWYVKPEIRYQMIRKWEYFLKDAMSYKPLDRHEVRTKDLVLSDGMTYEEFNDPFRQVARHLWNDMQNYELRAGHPVQNFEALRVSIPDIRAVSWW